MQFHIECNFVSCYSLKCLSIPIFVSHDFELLTTRVEHLTFKIGFCCSTELFTVIFKRRVFDVVFQLWKCHPLNEFRYFFVLSPSKCKMYEVVFVDSFLSRCCLWASVKQLRYNIVICGQRDWNQPRNTIFLVSPCICKCIAIILKWIWAERTSSFVRAMTPTECIHYELKNAHKYFPILSTQQHCVEPLLCFAWPHETNERKIHVKTAQNSDSKHRDNVDIVPEPIPN